MIPSFSEFAAFLIETTQSKLPVPKGRELNVNAGTALANELEPDVFDMIQKSYANIGGHLKIRQPSDVSQEYSVWNLVDVDDDPEPDVARLSSPSPETGGLKGGAVATDGTPAAKMELLNLLRKFYNTPGNWSEVSGPLAKVLISKLGLPSVDNEKKVRQVLKGKDITWNGDVNPEGDNLGASGWYTRNIAGHPHTKIIVGNI